MTKSFESWIDELREDVIEGEFGYEPGEFDVFPEMWRGLFDEGLTPLSAFQRALDAHAQARREADEEQRLNCEHLWAEAAALAEDRP